MKTSSDTSDDRVAQRVTNARSVPPALAALAFWGAIVLPVLYVPLLVAGLTSFEEFAVFLGLVALHAFALLGGRQHSPHTG